MKDEYFKYLFELQRSGETNMFAAANYLVHKFGIEQNEAKAVLLEWMKDYDEIATRLGIET